MKTIFSIFLLTLFLGLTSSSMAQDYSISQKSQRINNVKYDGYAVQVNGPLEKVANQMYSYLKERSKVRRKRNYYSITEFKMDKLSVDSTEVLVKIDEKESASIVWMAPVTNGLEKDQIDEINNSIQAELVLMARSYYVHQQELKIQEAEAAAQVISKKQQNLIEQNESLTKELSDAKARKIELENLLEENRLKIATLKQRLIDNKADQDSTYLDLQKVTKVIEGHKEGLKKIN